MIFFILQVDTITNVIQITTVIKRDRRKPMKNIPSISAAEWDVMNVVWKNTPITARDIVELLAKKRTWNPRTIKTMLNRLVKKGVLNYEVEGNAYLYRPAISKTTCVKEEGRSFMDRVFGGAPTPMLVHFVKNTKLSKEEIEELKSILSEKEK